MRSVAGKGFSSPGAGLQNRRAVQAVENARAPLLWVRWTLRSLWEPRAGIPGRSPRMVESPRALQQVNISSSFLSKAPKAKRSPRSQAPDVQLVQKQQGGVVWGEFAFLFKRGNIKVALKIWKLLDRLLVYLKKQNRLVSKYSFQGSSLNIHHIQQKKTARLALRVSHLWPRTDACLTPWSNPMTCLSRKKKKPSRVWKGVGKKLKSRSRFPLPRRDRRAACPFLTISVSSWLKIHSALTVSSPLANSSSPAHGVGVRNSLEATRDRAWPARLRAHWRKSKNNRCDPAAVGFTWSSKICWVATTFSPNDSHLSQDPVNSALIFDSDFTAALRQRGYTEFWAAINSSVNLSVSNDCCAKGLT